MIQMLKFKISILRLKKKIYFSILNLKIQTSNLENPPLKMENSTLRLKAT